MNEILILALLLALAVIAITILIISCWQLQSQVGARARDLTHAQTQLSSRNDEFIHLQSQMNNLAQRQFTAWRDQEIQTVREELHKNVMEQARNAFQQWQMETEANIRADAIKRSSAVVSGKVTEHLMPYMGIFPYNPKDARFLGAPIDLIVFNGLSEGNLQEIIFLEVKTGASSLSARERQIREVVSTRKVSWREFRVTT
jgi:predicted Holliday junction resolvase-like endonuclease